MLRPHLPSPAGGATARLDGGGAFAPVAVPHGVIPADPVGADSLTGVPRIQVNPSRWDGRGWPEFVTDLRGAGVLVREDRARGAR
ncbi:MAG: hypothetical protein HUU15_18635, partial [Candidatus Brocadiae bacterium]|nr:hypothetical protein [Candidatus Brocadiia bacterium]